MKNPDTSYLYNDNLCIPDSDVVVGATVLVPPVTKDLYWRTFYKYLFIFLLRSGVCYSKLYSKIYQIHIQILKTHWRKNRLQIRTFLHSNIESLWGKLNKWMDVITNQYETHLKNKKDI